MKPRLTDTLCTKCGLCCDGSLFADVELADHNEALTLEVMGLSIEDDDDASGALLLQPCAALKGKCCSLYPYRPKCCRSFKCRLLMDAERGTVSVARAGKKITEALKLIERVKTLVAQLGPDDELMPLKERCAEALSREVATDSKLNRKRAELQAAMTAAERCIQATFLATRPSVKATPSAI